MQFKYILVLVLFFGNLVVTLMERITRDMSVRSMLLTRRQRIQIRINEIIVTVLLVLMFVYLLLCYGKSW